MNEAEVANTVWWFGFWGQIEHWAFFAVVFFLAIEFIALKAGEPYKTAIEHERELAVSEAKERAAKAEIALEKFKAPRVFNPQQMADITQRMSKWLDLPKSGLKQRVAVFSTAGTFESEALANQIAAALGKAGWVISRYPITYEISLTILGIGLLISSSPRGLQVASDLANVLSNNGVATFIVPQRRNGSCAEETAKNEEFCSSISVMVGEKPSP